MGIQRLLPFLRNADENVSAIKTSHLSEFRGQKAAVDAYSWLHKGIYCCANDLFFNKPTTKYVDYCLKNLKLLQDHSITPVLVFDGAKMPLKVVNDKRQEDRQKAKREADDLIAGGRMNEAYTQMVQSISITHEMATNLIKAARKIGVESVVAPYEADAQLVYLEREGLVNFIISEDSDLIVFGARKVFLKMAPSGHGDIFDADSIELCLQANKRLNGKFVPQKLLYSAILSGCDYLKNLPGIGLVKAWKFMNMTENSDVRQFLKKIPSYLKLSIIVEDEYIEGFINAVLAFQHQVVFDTRQRKRVPLRPWDGGVSEDDYNKFLARFAATELDHLQLALGNIDLANQHYDSYHPHILSYLYYDVPEGKKTEVMSPVIGFKTDGVYRCTSQSGKSKRSMSCDLQQNCQADEDLATYYRSIDTSPRASVVNKEEPTMEPPRKRIRCKFFKCRSDGDELETVQSRFFKSKESDQSEYPDDIKHESHEQVEVKLNDEDIPKENISVFIETNCDNDDSEATVVMRDKEEDDLSQVFKDAGIELVSEDSSNCQEFTLKMKELNEQKSVTPVKEGNIIEIPDSPESPVITSQAIKITSKLKEIQNIQRFAKTKKKLIPKNQPTLLGFFTKL